MVRPEYVKVGGVVVARLLDSGYEFTGVGRSNEEAFLALQERLRQMQLKGEVASVLLFKLEQVSEPTEP